MINIVAWHVFNGPGKTDFERANAHHHPPGDALANSQTLCIGSGACCCWATLYALRVLASLKLLAVIMFSDNQGSRIKL